MRVDLLLPCKSVPSDNERISQDHKHAIKQVLLSSAWILTSVTESASAILETFVSSGSGVD